MVTNSKLFVTEQYQSTEDFGTVLSRCTYTKVLHMQIHSSVVELLGLVPYFYTVVSDRVHHFPLQMYRYFDSTPTRHEYDINLVREWTWYSVTGRSKESATATYHNAACSSGIGRCLWSVNKIKKCCVNYYQCFDAVDWAADRASGL